jgi:excisionase family DNA binding protein
MRRRSVAPEWIGIDEASVLAGVSRRTIHRWLALGRLGSRRLGRKVEIRRADVLPAASGNVSLLDLVTPLRDDAFATLLLSIHRDRGREMGRKPPRLG